MGEAFLYEFTDRQQSADGQDRPSIPVALVGVSHHTAGVDLRERFNVSKSAAPEALANILALGDLEGAAILSTCNRMEVVLSLRASAAIPRVVDWLAERANVGRDELAKSVYVIHGREVGRHLFRVASGLDSMIVGEPQIGGQVRESFGVSMECGALDPVLKCLFEQTMRVARKIRSESGIGELAVSIPYAGVELARKIFGNLEGLRVLLLGAGEMGELTAGHLAAQNVQQIFVANKTWERARSLAERFGGEAVQFDQFEEQLLGCDIVIASTAAPHFVVGTAHVERALQSRRSRGLFLIDLSVPRNIDPAIAEIEHVYLYNIDDLRSITQANQERRRIKAGQAEEIVNAEVVALERHFLIQDAVPTIRELQSRFEEIRVTELEKCLRRMGPVTAEQKAAVEQLTTQMVNKILHHPIVQLRESAEAPHERETLRQMIRKIFGLR